MMKKGLPIALLYILLVVIGDRLMQSGVGPGRYGVVELASYGILFLLYAFLYFFYLIIKTRREQSEFKYRNVGKAFGVGFWYGFAVFVVAIYLVYIIAPLLGFESISNMIREYFTFYPTLK
jgi:hypothetical protein